MSRQNDADESLQTLLQQLLNGLEVHATCVHIFNSYIVANHPGFAGILQEILHLCEHPTNKQTTTNDFRIPKRLATAVK